MEPRGLVVYFARGEDTYLISFEYGYLSIMLLDFGIIRIKKKSINSVSCRPVMGLPATCLPLFDCENIACHL